MASITRFEELVVWQSARKLTCAVYDATTHGPISKDYGLKDQLQRASVSIMSNIAEGFGYNSDKQFLRYLNIARGSGCEVQSLLYVAHDAKYFDHNTTEHLFSLARKTIALIASLQRHLNT